MTLRVLDLFSGIGGFSLGLERTGGFETAAFCEYEAFPRAVLAKHWPNVPCFPDVRELKGSDIDGPIDLICGGFPCQDISVAGQRKGIENGTRSGLWSEIVRLIGDLRPKYVIIENVANLLSGPAERPGAWFSRILCDLAQCGYDAEWENIPASFVGAASRRERIWIIAYPQRPRREGFITDNSIFSRAISSQSITCNRTTASRLALDVSQRGLRNRNDVSVKSHRDRLKTLGNAVVPQVVELIGHAILEAHYDA